MLYVIAFLLLLILLTLVKIMATETSILVSLEAQRTVIATIAGDVSSIAAAVDANPPQDLQPIADSVTQTDSALAALSTQVKDVLGKFPGSV